MRILIGYDGSSDANTVIAGVLLREAEEWAADCIVVGAQGLKRLQRLFIGSVSASVAARAGCSVEVIRSVEP